MERYLLSIGEQCSLHHIEEQRILRGNFQLPGLMSLQFGFPVGVFYIFTVLRAIGPTIGATDDHGLTTGLPDNWNLVFPDIPIRRSCHLVFLGKIDPELASKHTITGLRHFRVDDATVSQAIPMFIVSAYL
jgi:hypothetical protein